MSLCVYCNERVVYYVPPDDPSEYQSYIELKVKNPRGPIHALYIHESCFIEAIKKKESK